MKKDNRILLSLDDELFNKLKQAQRLTRLTQQQLITFILSDNIDYVINKLTAFLYSRHNQQEKDGL